MNRRIIIAVSNTHVIHPLLVLAYSIYRYIANLTLWIMTASLLRFCRKSSKQSKHQHKQDGKKQTSIIVIIIVIIVIVVISSAIKPTLFNQDFQILQILLLHHPQLHHQNNNARPKRIHILHPPPPLPLRTCPPHSIGIYPHRFGIHGYSRCRIDTIRGCTGRWT